jgi:hypothetical protein
VTAGLFEVERTLDRLRRWWLPECVGPEGGGGEQAGLGALLGLWEVGRTGR